MFKDWSIKKLLQFWATTTVIVVIIMAVMANYANSLISSTQSAFTGQLLPLENSSRQLNSVASALVNRQKQIIISESALALQQQPSREVLEQTFQQNWLRLSKVLETDETDRVLVNSLFEYYQDFLSLDDEVFTLKHQTLSLRDTLNRHSDDIEIQAGKVKQQLDSLETKLRNNNIADGVGLIQLLRPAAYELTVLNFKSFALNDDEAIERLAQQQLQPLQTQINKQLASLSSRLAGFPAVRQAVEDLQQDIRILIELIIGEQGLYALHTKRILTQTLLEQSQQSAIAVMTVIMNKLIQLAGSVNQQTYQSVAKNAQLADRTRWQIIVLSVLIILGMVAFAYLLFRGISQPLFAIRYAMHALSEGRFETRMVQTDTRNEVSSLAHDFNLFAENTEQLIVAFAEARHSLQSSEQHIRAILNSVPEAILTLSDKGIIQKTNPAAARVLHADEAELAGQSLLSFFADTEQIATIEDIVNCAESGNEFEGRRFDNSFMSMWVSLSRINSVDGDVWVCVISDVTAWKQTDKQLQQTTTELNAILENAMVGIAFIRDRHFIRVNHKFEQLFGYHRNQIEGGSTRCLYPNGRAYEQFGEQAYDVLGQGDSYEAQLELIRQNGESFWCAMSGKAIDTDNPLHGSIWLFEDVTNQRENEERLTKLASIDALTGLPNRGVFNDRLEHAIHKSHRNSGRLAVFFLDLDHFKHINDSLGHKAGDILLEEAARRIKSCVREGDTVARLGGDEFTLILEDIRSAEYVGKVAEKVIYVMSQPYEIDGTEVNISPSIGISLYPADGRDVDMLIRNADAAMYHAKKLGRNNFQFYSAEMNAEAAQRLAMETALRRAVEQQEFYLHYQPQIDLVSGTLAGAEVLLRWNSVQWGEIPPSRFVPILEDTGLIGQVGEWILRQACETYLELQDRLPADFMIAVNLSGRQFKGGRLASSIRHLLAETGMPAANLELEITESTLMDDTELAVATLRELSDMNISLAIDDFGTGYSSLSYLKQFPLNVLKIDSTFVRDVTHDHDDAAIVDAIMAMSHSLQLRVIAEGVETAEQLAFLQAHQCHCAQGYYFSRPVDKAAFIEFMHQEQYSEHGRARSFSVPG
ncbi:EAL domain-containing protein [Methylophaga sp. OBS4]|uniref:EAL domain-containing protein n=1 Tax=Methylophaga sp. OBS4 TaxID=2991935 RepID=UPI0022566E1F|nr:EAL domain-containing protein [Methylophaga sp. OBS4]MCX4188291.1 EAL domain-containing protein [Methylophaga sp. OBS4]